MITLYSYSLHQSINIPVIYSYNEAFTFGSNATNYHNFFAFS